MTRALVRLEPPYTRGIGGFRGATPLTRGPRLVRTHNMGRWHRTRAGIHYADNGATVFRVWCGQSIRFDDSITANELPADQPLCGTCEGRACGAGYPATDAPLNAALLFEPKSSSPPPTRCPSYRLHEMELTGLPLRGVFPCPVCGSATRLRATGGPYNSRCVIEGHPPGEHMIAPCPFHRWDQPALRNGVAGCSCGAPVRSAVTSAVMDRDL